MGPSVLYLKPTVRIKVGSAAHQKISGELAVMPKDERIEEIKNRAALPKAAPSFGALHGKYAKTLEGINVPVCLTAYGGAENYRTGERVRSVCVALPHNGVRVAVYQATLTIARVTSRACS